MIYEKLILMSQINISENKHRKNTKKITEQFPNSFVNNFIRSILIFFINFGIILLLIIKNIAKQNERNKNLILFQKLVSHNIS